MAPISIERSAIGTEDAVEDGQKMDVIDALDDHHEAIGISTLNVASGASHERAVETEKSGTSAGLIQEDPVHVEEWEMNRMSSEPNEGARACTASTKDETIVQSHMRMSEYKTDDKRVQAEDGLIMSLGVGQGALSDDRGPVSLVCRIIFNFPQFGLSCFSLSDIAFGYVIYW